MSISDLDQTTKPSSRRGWRLLAIGLLLGSAVIGLEMQHGVQAQTTDLPSHRERPLSESQPLSPSPEVTSSIGTVVVAKTRPEPRRTNPMPSRERIILIGLLGLCFAVMAFGGYRLWRRSVNELLR